jgi:putative transposase
LRAPRAYAVERAAEILGVQRDGFIKGKSAIHIARVYAGRRRNFVGQHFWAGGYWVSTVGKNEAAVRRYIQEQEKEDQRLEQLEMAAL